MEDIKGKKAYQIWGYYYGTEYTILRETKCFYVFKEDPNSRSQKSDYIVGKKAFLEYTKEKRKKALNVAFEHLRTAESEYLQANAELEEYITESGRTED